MTWMKWALVVWIALCPITLLNLYPVRHSGIYLHLASLTLLLLAVALRVWRRPQDLPWRSRLTVPLIALGVAAVASGLQGALIYDRTVFGAHRFVLVQIYAVALVVLSIGAAFAVSVLVRTADDLRWVRRAILFAAVAILADDLLGLPLRHVSWWPLVNTHATAMVLAYLFYEYQGSRVIVPALLFVAGTVVHVIVIPFLGDVSTQWLSGWTALGLPVGLLVLGRFPRAALGVAVPALILFLVWQFPMVQRVYEMARDEGDFYRFILWRDAIGLAFQRPLLGIGPGNYLDYIMRYGDLSIWLSSPHGNYQQIAAEMGFVGLGFALWVILRGLSLGLRLYRATADRFQRSMAIAATCSLAGPVAAGLIGDFLLPNYHNGGYINFSATVYSWIVLGILMSLERLAAESAATAPGAGRSP